MNYWAKHGTSSLTCAAFSMLMMLYFIPAKAQNSISIANVNTLTARFAKGNDTTYIVNFWATWCAPCRKELPEFESLNKRSAGKKVKVILVDMDDYPKATPKVEQFIEANKLTSEVIILKDAPGKLVSQFVPMRWNGSLPATLIIAANGGKHSFIDGPVKSALLQEIAR